MSEFLATTGCSLGHGIGSIISGGTFTVISTGDIKKKLGGVNVIFTKVDFTFVGGSASGCDPGTVAGGGSVLASSIKVRKKGTTDFVVRQNDESTTGPFAGTIGGNPVPLGNQPVKVIAAGQTKARSD